MSLDVKWLKDHNDTKFYPVTHANATICGEDKILNDVIDEITEQVNSSIGSFGRVVIEKIDE